MHVYYYMCIITCQLAIVVAHFLFVVNTYSLLYANDYMLILLTMKNRVFVLPVV